MDSGIHLTNREVDGVPVVGQFISAAWEYMNSGYALD